MGWECRRLCSVIGVLGGHIENCQDYNGMVLVLIQASTLTQPSGTPISVDEPAPPELHGET